jgi:RHS repeat-associated protein
VQVDAAANAFGFDTAGRLATVQKSGATIAAYSYDLNGNRLQATYPSGNVVGTVDSQDRLLSYGTSTYAYTGNGELKLKVTGTDSTKYRYDAFGNLRDVYLPTGDHIEYVIDAQQRRIGRKLNGTLQKGWLYQSQLAIAAEVDPSGAVTKTFEYATHGNVPDWMYANGVPYRIVTDHLGSVRMVVDVNGTVAQRIDYDAYGRVLTNTNPGFQPFGYAGGLLDDATGLTRFGARDYDADNGRWTTRDPGGLANGSNQFVYALGAPNTVTDPDGQFPVVNLVSGGIGAVVNIFGLAVGEYLASRWQEREYRLSLREILATGTSGFVSGFIAPWVATSRFRAGLLGGLSGALQELLSRASCDQTRAESNLRVAEAFGIGFLSGTLGGPFRNVSEFDAGSNISSEQFRRVAQSINRNRTSAANFYGWAIARSAGIATLTSKSP